MITCTRKIEFDAAHRVMEHESKCRDLHGHRYIIEATFSAEKLDKLGRVIDFGAIYQTLGDWVDTHWDHTTLLHQNDKALGEAIANETGQTIFYFPHNPTAENIASYLFEIVCPELFNTHKVTCHSIRIYETPNCFADVN